MATINPALLTRLQKKLGVGPRQVYRLIEQKAVETQLDRRHAAIVLASEHGIGSEKYATSEDRATIRGANSPRSSPAPTPSLAPAVRRVVRSIEPVNLDLSFVSSNELRQILQRDVGELNTALSQSLKRTAKTCMVLCGSLAEALLLDCLLQHQAAVVAVASTLPKKPSPDLEVWDLSLMVTVATQLTPPLLPDDAVAGAEQLRHWRNLIHPGRELKEARNKRIKPTPARAWSAISFLQLIAEELGP